MAKSAKRAASSRMTINVRNPALLKAAIERMTPSIKAAMAKALIPSALRDDADIGAGSVSSAIPAPSVKMWSIWNCPKLAGGEPTSLAFTGPHDQVYPMYVQASGKNPDETRTYVMAPAEASPPQFAG